MQIFPTDHIRSGVHPQTQRSAQVSHSDRDLKPENLLLDFDKNIKIVDFGLSNTYVLGEKLKTACGSPCYAAPEMIAGKKYIGIQVDIWSCGVILFALLCGYLPFENTNTAQLYKTILNGEYTIPKHVSPDAKSMIQGILNTDPSARFTIEDIRKHPWYKISQPKEHTGIIIGEHKIPIDLNVVEETMKLGFKKEVIIKSIEGNKHTSETSSYYILLKKHLRKGEISPANLNSDDLVPVSIGKAVISMRDTPKAANLIKMVNKDIINFNGTTPKINLDSISKKYTAPNPEKVISGYKKISINRKSSPKNILNMTALGPININWVSNGKDPQIDISKQKIANINVYNRQSEAQTITIHNNKTYSVTPLAPNKKRDLSLQYKPQEPTGIKPTNFFNRNRAVKQKGSTNKKGKCFINIYSAYRNKAVDRVKLREKLNITSGYEEDELASKYPHDFNQTVNLSLINQRRAKSRDMPARKKK